MQCVYGPSNNAFLRHVSAFIHDRENCMEHTRVAMRSLDIYNTLVVLFFIDLFTLMMPKPAFFHRGLIASPKRCNSIKKLFPYGIFTTHSLENKAVNFFN